MAYTILSFNMKNIGGGALMNRDEMQFEGMLWIDELSGMERNGEIGGLQNRDVAMQRRRVLS